MKTYTLIHVAISLVGIFSGFVVLYGLLSANRLERWTSIFLWSTVLVYHGTFCINSLAHVRGRKRYVTGDDSRNNWLLALVTMGFPRAHASAYCATEHPCRSARGASCWAT